jgi:hypothetical protein
MTELDELIRRDVDATSPSPTSPRANRPILLAFTGWVVLLVMGLSSEALHLPKVVFDLAVIASGALVIAAGHLLRSDYEDSINWFIKRQRNPVPGVTRNWTLPPTHEQRRAYVQTLATCLAGFGVLLALVGVGALFGRLLP